MRAAADDASVDSVDLCQTKFVCCVTCCVLQYTKFRSTTRKFSTYHGTKVHCTAVGIDRLNSLRSKIDSCERALAEKTAK